MSDVTDHAALFGQHVRIRPADKPANARYCADDRFGVLVDLGSHTVAGLRDRGDTANIRACWLDGYRIQPYPYLRIHVFWWQQEECWSWCREIGGDLYDHSHSLPRFDSRTEASDAGWKWLADTEAALVAKALTANGA